MEDGKIIYLFLPYYKNATGPSPARPASLGAAHSHLLSRSAARHRSQCRSSAPDAIRDLYLTPAEQVNGTRYPEREMLHLFLGTCLAVRAMHKHVSGPQASYPPSASSPSSSKRGAIRAGGDSTEEDDDDEGVKGVGEGEALISGGGLESVKEQLGEDGALGEPEGEAPGKDVPWAHRDIKPVRSPFVAGLSTMTDPGCLDKANVMIADDGPFFARSRWPTWRQQH